jgi:chromosome partitioning protein
MRRIVVANQKGGVAKSSTVLNVAWSLQRRGQRVLVVDVDPQANATSGFVGMEQPEPTLYEVFEGDTSLAETLVPVADGLDLVPGSLDLADADFLYAARLGRESILAKALNKVTKSRKRSYDFVILDTPPFLGLLTANAFLAAQEVLIPVTPSLWAMRGIAKLEAHLERVRADLSHDLRLLGAVAQMVDNTLVSRDALDILREHFGDRLFAATIPRTVRMEEANAAAESIFTHAPGSPAAQAYDNLTEEILSRG